jgi:hypothetical protein
MPAARSCSSYPANFLDARASTYRRTSSADALSSCLVGSPSMSPATPTAAGAAAVSLVDRLGQAQPC